MFKAVEIREVEKFDDAADKKGPKDWESLTSYQVGDVVAPLGTVVETGSTVHEAGCTCGFCKLGDTRA